MTANEAQGENTIPKGKYTYIGVDIDTTGRRILDEVRFFRVFFFNKSLFLIFFPNKKKMYVHSC